MENTSKQQRHHQDKSDSETTPYTVVLEVETAEWAKKQPGGMSKMLRRYLREQYEKAKKTELGLGKEQNS